MRSRAVQLHCFGEKECTYKILRSSSCLRPDLILSYVELAIGSLILYFKLEHFFSVRTSESLRCGFSEDDIVKHRHSKDIEVPT